MNAKKTPFLWGAATSSHQVEGGNRFNDWYQWEEQGFVEGGVKSGAATDHWNRFREDLLLAKDLGLNSYRFSVEWSRIEPSEGNWDPRAIERYQEIIHECEKLGLKPMLTLHHFTLPAWFAQTGGFTRSDASEKFGRYVKKVVKTLGPHIPLWCTLNEPMVLAIGGYLGKFMPPAAYSPERVGLVNRTMLKCHITAYDIIHREVGVRKGPWKTDPLQVGIAHNVVDFKADRAWNFVEAIAARVLRKFYNELWVYAVLGKKVRFGAPGFIPFAPVLNEALGRRTIDFLGLNYYTEVRVRLKPGAKPPLDLCFARPSDIASDVGWAVHPKGLKKILSWAGTFKLPLYITENGIADRSDNLRGKYIFDHMKVLADAVAAGVDVRGYYHWSLLDNFEWIKGYGPRFGLYSVDYETFERRPRPSAFLYRKLIHAHRSQGDLPPQINLLW